MWCVMARKKQSEASGLAVVPKLSGHRRATRRKTAGEAARAGRAKIVDTDAAADVRLGAEDAVVPKRRKLDAKTKLRVAIDAGLVPKARRPFALFLQDSQPV